MIGKFQFRVLKKVAVQGKIKERIKIAPTFKGTNNRSES